MDLERSGGRSLITTASRRLSGEGRRSWAYKRLRHRTCKTSGSSQKKVPANYGDFDFFFSKYPRFSNLKLDFFPLKKSFSQIFQNTAHLFHLNFISKKTPKKSEKLFFPPKPPILKVEVGFFSSKKKFFSDFPKYGKIIPSKPYF